MTDAGRDKSRKLESRRLQALMFSALVQAAQGGDASSVRNAPEPIAFLKASNARYDNYFGISIDISGDTLLVGAHGEASKSTGVGGEQANSGSWFSGAAYVYRREGEHWRQEAFLKGSTNQECGQFGISCSLKQDTAAIGSSELLGTGAAYVFVRTGSTWKEQARLRPRAAALHDQFGAAVALSGNMIVVGAPEDRSLAKGVDGNSNDNSDLSVGAAYVFEKTARGWEQAGYVKPSNSRGGFRFGQAVAVSGETIVVGAWGEDSLGRGVGADQEKTAYGSWQCGAAYVFVRRDGKWRQQAYLKASNADREDQFGRAASISGDTIVVGAPGESSDSAGIDGDQDNNKRASAGAVYVFVRKDGQWTQQAYVKGSALSVGSYFGESVVISGDTLVVGSSMPEGGSAYIFSRRDGKWREVARLTGANARREDRFGTSVAISGRLLAVGATGEASEKTDSLADGPKRTFKESGAAYILRLPEN